MTKERIDSYRRRLWHLGRVKTESQFRAVLNRVGLCLIFGSREVPVPKVYDIAHDDADWWNWKDHLQAKKQAYLGRLIQSKATLVSMELLPAFLALYYAQGGSPSYDEEHYYGRLTQQAKWICDELDRKGPCPADRLRKDLKQQQGIGTGSFHKGLLELQRKFKVVTTGLVNRGWGTRIIGLFEQWVPDSVEREARRMKPEKARQMILQCLIRSAGAVPLPMLPRLLVWSEAQRASALKGLFQHRLVRPETWSRSKERHWIVWNAF